MKNRSILFIDDEEVILEGRGYMLESEGYSVFKISCGEEGIK